MTASETANGMTRTRVIRQLSTDLPCRGRGGHRSESEGEPSHSRSKLDLAKGAGCG